MNKEKLFRKLVENNADRDAYFMSIPADISMAFIDNQYVNSLINERDIMLKMIFGDHTYSVEWFLYEWKPGMEVGFDGNMTAINNIDEYIDFMKTYEGFE